MQIGLMRSGLLEQIGVRASVGEREDEYVVLNVIEKEPIVLDMAVTESGKIAGERVVFVFSRKGLASRKHRNNGLKLADVLSSTKHFLQVFPEARQFYDFKLHARRNSLSFAGSVQRGAVGSFAILRDSSRSSTSRSCLLFLASAKGIPPTSRILAIKQLKAVDIFIPMSSSISSTSSFRAASVRNVMLVVIVCTPIVSQSAIIIPYCSNSGNTPSRNFAPTLQLTPSRRNGRISWFNISAIRRRLAPSIRLRNHQKGIRNYAKWKN